MSSIMRARSGLMGRGEGSEVIGGLLSRAEGCWTFDARDQTPRSSLATVLHLEEIALTAMRAPSRERVRSSAHLRRSRADKARTEVPPTADVRMRLPVLPTFQKCRYPTTGAR